MAAWLDATLRLAAFAIVQLVPAVAALRAARWLLPGAPAACRACAAMIFWATWLVLALRLLGTLAMLRLGPLLALALATCWLAHLTLPRGKAHGADLRGAPGALLAAWRRQGRACRAGLLLLAVPCLVVTARALAMPPLAWDSLTYHLAFAAHWLQAGGMVPFFGPDGVDSYSHFPHNGELLGVAFLLPFHADTFANLLDFPFLLLTAAALWALGAELDLARRDRALLAALLCTSPMLLAYVTTAYVDVQVAAELLCAVLFLQCWRRTGDPAHLLPMLLAAGLALGTKVTALPLVLLVCALALAHGWLARGAPAMTRRGALLLGIGLAACGALALPRYVANWSETGNPFYPLGFSIPAIVSWPPSRFVQRSLAETGLGNATQDLRAGLALLRYGGSLGWARAAGPIFLPLGLLALAAPLRARRPQERTASLLLALLWIVPLALFALDGSPDVVVARRFWSVDCARFLAAPLALMALAALVALRGRWLLLARLGILAAIAGNLAFANWRLLDPVSSLVLTALGAGLVVASAWALRALARRARWLAAAGACGAIMLLGVWLAVLTARRDARRWAHYAEHVDLHPVPIRALVPGWQACDVPERSATIALTVGWDLHGMNWFCYPLMGRHLQNRVVYAAIDRVGTYPTSLHSGLLREHGDYATWLANLEQERVDLVFVQWPEPIELAWMTAHPERFALQQRGDQFAIFRLRR